MPKELDKRIEDVAVVYLSWIPYGKDLLIRFINSYTNSQPGCPHQLYIILNGKAVDNRATEFRKIIMDKLPHANILEMKKGQDINAYFFAASIIDSELFFFVNSYSEFQSDNWLMKFVNALDVNIGLLGATGSFQSLFSTSVYETRRSLKDSRPLFKFRQFKMLLKAWFYWRFLFPPFPNPHLRTNGWMIRKGHMMKLRLGRLKTKFDAYQFESGRKSLTNQVLKMGYKVAIIGKNGKVYHIDDWKESNTFWIQNQDNLLITDNQTILYQNASREFRDHLSLMAWGDR